jgi:hypothetical protein
MFSKFSVASRRLLQVPLAHYGITPQFMHPLDAELLLDESPKSAKRTKTICTIGYPRPHTAPGRSTPTTQACWSTRE